MNRFAKDNRSRVEREGLKTTSGTSIVGDAGKSPDPTDAARTTASTSRKVAVCLRYQGPFERQGICPSGYPRLPKECHQTVETKQGEVERSMARSGPLALRLTFK